jgi:hypothetical protein
MGIIDNHNDNFVKMMIIKLISSYMCKTYYHHNKHIVYNYN